LTLIIYYLIFFQKDFSKNVIVSFVKAMNNKISQGLLFSFMLYEQLIFTHPLITFLFGSSFVILYFESALANQFFATCLLHSVFSLGLIYVRIRKNLLNVNAFALAGMNINRSSGAWDWNSILEGFDRVVQFQLARLAACDDRSECNERSERSESTTSAVRMGVHNRCFAIETNHILNKVPTTIQMPFFPLNNRRNMTTRAAFRKVGQMFWESLKEQPIPTTTVVTGAVSGTLGGAYLEVQREQFRVQREQFREACDLESRRLDLESRKFDLAEQGKLPVAADLTPTQPYVQMKPDGTFTSNLPGAKHQNALATDVPIEPNPPVGPNCCLEQSQINAICVKFCETLQIIFGFFV
jgi:hypothetical protein